MTESEWANAIAPMPMLRFLLERHWASNRRLRLFACACCRRTQEGGANPAVLVSESVADGLVHDTQLRVAREVFTAVWTPRPTLSASNAAWATLEDVAASAAALASTYAADSFGYGAVENAASDSAASMTIFSARRDAEERVQAALVRDIFGNPWRAKPALLNNDEVVKLAQATYDNREMPSGHLDRTRLAELADALQEAGC